jgi:carboxyl-terminal processing protease
MKRPSTKMISIITSIAGLIFLSACGGSGNSPEFDAIDWTKQEFGEASQFKNLCQVPRTDLNGNAFRDRSGSTLQENQWLRAWSYDTYLWYDEIIYQDPALFTSTDEFFDTLKTDATTPSGGAKDNFHFSLNTEQYLQQSQSGISSGYGVQWALVSTTPPRELRVAFTQPNSPAFNQNLSRGAEILEIDGVDLINAGTQAEVDVLNAGISPRAVGETHTFLVRDLGATQTRTVTLTSAVVQESAVLASDVITTNSGNVAYLMYNTFRAFSETELVAAMNAFADQDITDLVLDLRYNGGGLLDLASEVAYMIVGDTATQDKIFEQTIFNAQHPTINPVTGATLRPVPFFNTSTSAGILPAGTALPALNLTRVFVLTTGRTCSASEAVINGLRGIDIDVILIGDSTCGKPYGFYPTDNCGTTYFTIQFTGANDKGFGEYPDGFTPENSTGPLGVTVPGCSVPDDYDHALGDPEEALLKQALEFRDTGTCTAQPVSKSQMAQNKPESSIGLPLTIPAGLVEKIITQPSSKTQ